MLRIEGGKGSEFVPLLSETCLEYQRATIYLAEVLRMTQFLADNISPQGNGERNGAEVGGQPAVGDFRGHDEATLPPLGDTLCFGAANGTATVAATGGTTPYQYLWSTGSQTTAAVSGLSSAMYSVTVTDANACSSTASIFIPQQQPLSITASGGSVDCAGSSNGTATVTSAMYGSAPTDLGQFTYLWSSNPPQTGIVANNLIAGQSCIVGCTAEDRILVDVEKPRRIHVPTGFSPNGDGNNDLLLVHGQQGVRVVSFQVYDRWGELVYEGRDFPVNDPSTGWDGTFRGEAMNPGVFMWVLEVEFADGKLEVYRGNTMLIK
jgi:gliding motility-associated-like protein